jgi:hypothetical protein
MRSRDPQKSVRPASTARAIGERSRSAGARKRERHPIRMTVSAMKNEWTRKICRLRSVSFARSSFQPNRAGKKGWAAARAMRSVPAILRWVGRSVTASSMFFTRSSMTRVLLPSRERRGSRPR